MSVRKMALVAVTATAAVVGAASAASAAPGPKGHEVRPVRVTDDCDPASFNAAIGPGTCVGDGRTTFPSFIQQLQTQGAAKGWAFKPHRTSAHEGVVLDARNRGGEFHTFTEVAAFGGGCVPQLNAILGLTPVPECATPGVFETTGLPPGEHVDTAGLSPGVHHFQCLIHPWMHLTVTVKPD